MFVGEDRQALVDDLVAAYARVAAGEGPELVCLVAPIGWGKTRIVQEFYARLAAEYQGDPAYWPASIVEATDVTEPTKLRKRVHPGRFTVPGGAVPEWFWWALSCQRKADGQPAQAIEEAKEQIFVHAEGLEQGLTRAQRARQGLTKDEVRSKASALAGLLGVFVPPVGWAATVHDSVGQLYETGKGFFEARRRQARLEADRMVDAEQADRSALVEELAGSLARLSTDPAPLPVVVVVDDAHDAAPSTVALIDRLLAHPTARVLVVATAWPDQLALQVSEGRGFGSWLHSADPGGASRVELAALSEGDLDHLLRAAAPATSAEVAAGLVARAGGNPFVLGLILSLPVLRRSMAEGAIGLSVDRIAGVPNEIRRLYLEKWNDLPESVREVLAVASVQGAVFVEDCARGAALVLGLDAVDEAMPRARDPYAWVRAVDDAVRAFVEAAQFDVAADAARNEVLSEEEIHRVRTALVDYVLARREDGTFEDLSTDAQRHLLRQHVALVEEGFVGDLRAAGLSAVDLARDYASSFALSEAISVGERGISLLEEAGDSDLPEAFVARTDLADWFIQCGRMDDALSCLENLLSDQIRVLGEGHPATLATRYSAVNVQGAQGEVLLANQRLEEVLTDQIRVLGPDHPDTLRTRRTRALVASEPAYIRAEYGIWALNELEEVLSAQVRVMGADHPDAWETLNMIALCAGKLGETGAALVQMQEVLAAMQRLLGSGHPATMTARNSVAFYLGRSGQEAASLAQFEALLADQEQLLGPQHVVTKRTRENLEWLRQWMDGGDGSVLI